MGALAPQRHRDLTREVEISEDGSKRRVIDSFHVLYNIAIGVGIDATGICLATASMAFFNSYLDE